MAINKKSIKIPPAPIPDPLEIPPENESYYQNSTTTDGFNLIKHIYDFFSVHDSLMYSTYSKYKKLGLNWLLDFCFAIISFFIDTIHNITIYMMIFLILFVLAFSLAKLVGLIDFVMNLIFIK